MSSVRAGAILAGFMALTLPLMPVQAVLIRASPRAARRFPHWYHRQVCRLLGLRITVEGQVQRDRPVLLISNHTSWLDIPLLSAVAPVSFVAKREVGSWPLVSSLARLQRSVFVDRQRRTAAAGTADEMAARLAAGDTIVLFAEGTSSDGNRVLPFLSSLFAAVKSGSAAGVDSPSGAVSQTCAIVYTRLHGIPVGRAGRPHIGWYGDMDMQNHAWELLKRGPIDVTVRIGPPVPIDAFADRKALARESEDAVRRDVVRILRGRKPGDAIETVKPPAASLVPRPGRGQSSTWQ